MILSSIASSVLGIYGYHKIVQSGILKKINIVQVLKQHQPGVLKRVGPRNIIPLGLVSGLFYSWYFVYPSEKYMKLYVEETCGTYGPIYEQIWHQRYKARLRLLKINSKL